MSNLTVNQLASGNPTTNLITVAAGDKVYSPGSVVQVIQVAITTPTAVSVPANAAAFTSIPDLAATITPVSAASKIYVQVRWFGELGIQTETWNSMFGVKRNGINIGLNPSGVGLNNPQGLAMASISYYANDANSTPEQCMFDYLDSPASASPITYQAYINALSAYTLYTNRTVTASTGGYEYGTSTITLWEIAQ